MTVRFQVLCAFLVMEVGSRRILHYNVTVHPTADWTLQQFREAIPSNHGYQFLIHDRDSIFSRQLDKQRKSDFDLKVLRTPVRAPTANSYCERLVGTVRRRSDESLGRDEHREFVQPTFGHSALTCLKRWSREDLILLSSVSSLITRLQLRLESVQQNPQQPVAAVEAQATRRVLLQNRELVTEREDLRLQAQRGPENWSASSAYRATKSELDRL